VKLRQVEVLMGQGILGLTQSTRSAVTEQTYYRWKKKSTGEGTRTTQGTEATAERNERSGVQFLT